MIILVDMDNTLADFDAAFLSLWQKTYPDEFFIPLDKRRGFHLAEDYPDHLLDKIQKICDGKNFVKNLPPISGGIEAVRELLDAGHDVRFCSSHFREYKNCITEKYQWIEKHFGKEAVDRIIMTRDKTLVRGDLLIDDKPKISGLATPTWEHILYDRPHNRQITDKRRLAWDNWRDIIFA